MPWYRNLRLPYVTIFLVIVLTALTLCLPRYGTNSQSAAAHLLARSATGTRFNMRDAGSSTMVAQRVSSGWEISDPQETSWDLASRIADGKVPGAFLFRYSQPLQIDSGLYALTRRETIENLTIWPENPDDRGERRAVALHFLSTHGYAPDVVARLKDGNVYTSVPLVGGYIYNAVAGTLLVLLIWSFAWIVLVPSWVAGHRSRKRIARGLCPTCSYSLRDLQNSKCPECGTALVRK